MFSVSQPVAVVDREVFRIGYEAYLAGVPIALPVAVGEYSSVWDDERHVVSGYTEAGVISFVLVHYSGVTLPTAEGSFPVFIFDREVNPEVEVDVPDGI